MGGLPPNPEGNLALESAVKSFPLVFGESGILKVSYGDTFSRKQTDKCSCERPAVALFLFSLFSEANFHFPHFHFKQQRRNGRMKCTMLSRKCIGFGTSEYVRYFRGYFQPSFFVSFTISPVTSSSDILST